MDIRTHLRTNEGSYLDVVMIPDDTDMYEMEHLHSSTQGRIVNRFFHRIIFVHKSDAPWQFADKYIRLGLKRCSPSTHKMHINDNQYSVYVKTFKSLMLSISRYQVWIYNKHIRSVSLWVQFFFLLPFLSPPSVLIANVRRNKQYCSLYLIRSIV